jgi:hypothetical protein
LNSSIGSGEFWKIKMSNRERPKWPMEAHPWRDEATAYRRRAQESALGSRRAKWRTKAVSLASEILEGKIPQGPKGVYQPAESDAIAASLRQANLLPSNHTLPGVEDNTSNNLLLGTVVGEAAAILLKRRTELETWAVACRLWFNFEGALPAFRARLQSEFRADRSFRKRFDTLTKSIVDRAVADPAHKMSPQDRDNFLALIENWRKTKDLRSVWFGLRQLRHPLVFGGEVDAVVYVYLAIDPARASQALERFDNPYQISMTLSPLGGLGLNQSFMAWADLLKCAAPCFAEDGTWTGGTLEPLLLAIAQDALQEARLPLDTADDVVIARDDELKTLAVAIGKIISEKRKGPSLALRWGAWLFRASAGSLDAESQQYPKDLRQSATPPWRMLEALARSEAASTWNAIAASDSSPEEVLYLLCAKILAASERKSDGPDKEPLWRCIPTVPEDYLGESGRATRNLTSLFSLATARPDGLRYRTLSMLFFQREPLTLYRELWNRTLALRELTEHWQSGDQDDGRNDAKRTIAMVLAIGLCLVDYYAIVESPPELTVAQRLENFGDLFRLVYDGLREMQVIELFDQAFLSSLYGHLLIRRALYENPNAGGITVVTPLSKQFRPTLPDMLAHIAGVTQPFFQGLDGLQKNGVSADRILTALRDGGVDLPMLVDCARNLGRIDAHRPLQFDAAARIAEQSVKDQVHAV